MLYTPFPNNLFDFRSLPPESVRGYLLARKQGNNFTSTRAQRPPPIKGRKQ